MSVSMLTRLFGRVALLAAPLAFAYAGGCASSNQSNSPTTTPSPATAGAVAAAGSATDCRAECLVCKENADLACVDVKVKGDTPRAEYNGKSYYFCSDDCRREFLKHPEKYAR